MYKRTAYTNATPHFPAHVPYTNYHVNMTLTEEDIVIKGFDLTDKRSLPPDIIKKCLDHSKINWPRKKNEKEARTKLGSINAENEQCRYRELDEHDKEKNGMNCTNAGWDTHWKDNEHSQNGDPSLQPRGCCFFCLPPAFSILFSPLSLSFCSPSPKSPPFVSLNHQNT